MLVYKAFNRQTNKGDLNEKDFFNDGPHSY